VTEQRRRPDANHCFVCGPDNPFGLRLAFRMDGDVCRSEFLPGPFHGGYQELTHGGIIYSVLDDVMANWLFLQGARGHTAKCEIRYREPLQLGEQLLLEGRLVKRKGRVVMMRGIARRANDLALIAEAEGSFVIVDGIERLSENDS
jgi:acyl-coenzyme A thioesterase PaaI-like protein